MAYVNLPPDVRTQYTDVERSVIAGYLLRMRGGLLEALASSAYGDQHSPGEVGDFAAEYYSRAESYSRFLLYWIGYSVPRGGMYDGANVPFGRGVSAIRRAKYGRYPRQVGA